MKYSKVDEIECGEKTCASGPGPTNKLSLAQLR